MDNGTAAEPPAVREADAPTPATASTSAGKKKPTVIIVLGMAGTGKTSLMQRLNSHLHQSGTPPYVVNLDPAVTYMPYSPNIDIRDTVDYKNVMKQYNLGPNGGILTACNLFATQFDQVIQLCEQKDVEYILVDTPGQIEIFTWSASGAIVTEAFASSFPTVVCYVCDTPRCMKPNVFMSNMLQAVSILYKCQLPLILAFNKVDVAGHEFALEWMADFETFQEAVDADSSYSSNLARSLCLVLDEFYQSLKCAGVSAVTGQGMDQFFEVWRFAPAHLAKLVAHRVEDIRTTSAKLGPREAAQAMTEQYNSDYLPELESRKAQKARQDAARKQVELDRFTKDMEAKPHKATMGLDGDDDDAPSDDDDDDDEHDDDTEEGADEDDDDVL